MKDERDVMEAKNMRKHSGTCHCGAVRFEVEFDPTTPAGRCNCSICTKLGALGGIVQPSAFTLVAGEEHLKAYEWGAKISKRFFCRECSIFVFGRGHLKEIGGDYVSINFNCLDDFEPTDLKVIYWDGRHDNWETGPRSTPWPISSRVRAGSAGSAPSSSPT